MIKKWKVRSIKKKVWPKKWLTVDEYVFERPDGKLSSWFVTPNHDVVIVFARTLEGKIVCITQYRQGIDMIDIGFPAGMVKKGQTPLQSAKEELEEEAGYRAKKWYCIDKRAKSAGRSTSWQHTYFADGCYCVGQKLEEDEWITVGLHTLDEVDSLVGSKKIKDLGSAIAGLVGIAYIKNNT